LLKVEHLITYRQGLVKSKRGRPAVALELAAKELACFSNKQFSARILKDSQKHIKQLQESISSIDKQLEQVIKEDAQLHRVYKLATSLTGIGLQTAALMMLHTNCFSSFDTWRQFVPAGNRCYSPTAPFEHSSATSIGGKTRLSKIANTKMKALLSNRASTLSP
jgi:transposase